jgi:hypothetical protein
VKDNTHVRAIVAIANVTAGAIWSLVLKRRV